MKHITIIIGLLVVLYGTAVACTDEEFEKMKWLQAKEASAARIENYIVKLQEKKDDLSEDINSVKTGTWPISKKEDQTSDDVSSGFIGV